MKEYNDHFEDQYEDPFLNGIENTVNKYYENGLNKSFEEFFSSNYRLFMSFEDEYSNKVFKYDYFTIFIHLVNILFGILYKKSLPGGFEYELLDTEENYGKPYNEILIAYEDNIIAFGNSKYKFKEKEEYLWEQFLFLADQIKSSNRITNNIKYICPTIKDVLEIAYEKKSAEQISKSIYGSGRKTYFEIEEICKAFLIIYDEVKYLSREAFADYLFAKNNTYLNSENCAYIKNFRKIYNYSPMFYMFSHLFDTPEKIDKLKSRKVKIQAYLYGFYDGSNHSLEEASSLFKITRERVRQIIEEKEIDEDNYLFDLDNWKHYNFESCLILEDYDFSSIITKENIEYNENQCYAVLTILGLFDVYYFSITGKKNKGGFNKSKPLVYHLNNKLKAFHFNEALTFLAKALPKTVIVEYQFDLKKLLQEDSLWDNCIIRNDILDSVFHVLVYLVQNILKVNLTEGGVIIIKPNKIDYFSIIYDIINENGSPMSIKDIELKMSELLPNDIHCEERYIRSLIQRTDGIEAIGKKSLYKLKEWSFVTESLSDIIVHFVKQSSIPLDINDLISDVLALRPDSTERSVSSVISQCVKNGYLIYYYRNRVGFSKANYSSDYHILPQTFEEELEEYRKFSFENFRTPLSSSTGWEKHLYTWHAKSSTLLDLNESQIIQYTELMNEIRSNYIPTNKAETIFYSNVKIYLNFVQKYCEGITKKVDGKLYEWFNKTIVRSFGKELTDFEEHYFLKLLQHLYLIEPKTVKLYCNNLKDYLQKNLSFKPEDEDKKDLFNLLLSYYNNENYSDECKKYISDLLDFLDAYYIEY